MLMSWIATLTKRLVAVFFVLIVGWHLANGAAPPTGRAVVDMGKYHDIVVSFDHGERLLSSSMGIPMSCELEPGKHVAQFWHQGTWVREATFEVRAGQRVVLKAIPPGALKGAEKRVYRPERPDAGLPGHDLAARVDRASASAIRAN